jgi:hypothetical protein
MFRAQTNSNESITKQEDPLKILVAKPWARFIETDREMSVKLDFIEKLETLCERLSLQRTEALKHYLDYSVRQHEINSSEENEIVDAEIASKKVKFKPGAGPSKTRVIVNERIKLTHDEIEQVRKYFHVFLQVFI